MKKVITMFTLVLLSILLVSCGGGGSSHDTSISVYFYTFANAAQDTTENAVISPQKNLEANHTIEEPETPTRSGHAFEGWYKDPGFIDEWIFETDKIGDKSITLYAKWLARPYMLSFDLNGGEFAENAGVNYVDEEGNPVMPYIYFNFGDSKVLPRPTRYGYVFYSWLEYDEFAWREDAPQSYRPGDKGYVSLPSTLSKDTTFYAHWDAVSVNISFNVNFPVSGGPAKPGTRSIKYDTELTFLQELVDATGTYVFKGWNDVKEGTGNWYENGMIFKEIKGKTLYAIWELKV